MPSESSPFPAHETTVCVLRTSHDQKYQVKINYGKTYAYVTRNLGDPYQDATGQIGSMLTPGRYAYFYGVYYPENNSYSFDAQFIVFVGRKPELALDFAYSGLDATYLKDMTPIRNARGRGALTLDSFHLLMDAGEVEPLLETPFVERDPALSPDGRWLTYSSTESGTEEVYVRPFPDVNGGGRWQVSTGRGQEPVWAHSGEELFFRSGDAVMAVPFETEPTFRPGRQERLFEDTYAMAPIFPADSPVGPSYIPATCTRTVEPTGVVSSAAATVSVANPIVAS